MWLESGFHRITGLADMVLWVHIACYHTIYVRVNRSYPTLLEYLQQD